MMRLGLLALLASPATLIYAQDVNTPDSVNTPLEGPAGESDLSRRWGSGRLDLMNDVSNCGKAGHKCQGYYVNGGHGVCEKGQCQTTCNDGFSWDLTSEYCRPTSRDVQNCGAIGRVCALEGAARSLCARGECFASSCKRGYELQGGVCYKIDVTSNVNHCGALYRSCAFYPLGASGECVNSECVLTSCPAKYSLRSGACVADPVKQRARVQKAKKVKPTLCPKGETACPIADSASFEHAAVHHFRTPVDEYSGIMAGAGGYECLDLQSSLESCGGCSSTGEGQDCSRIPHAAGVGCEMGTCRIFSCTAGYRPNLSGTGCIRGDEKGPRRRGASHRHAHFGFRHDHHS